ncbi:MAG: ornithine aminomutase subunit alpha [Fusobacterium gastrosuis]|uniref:ornithine aminomutase subunit alpha n=1 Tax=Fusobacterium gastrosuis TaxID=1755100 RepID=UPI001F4F7B65|nr:ornithine aminomutase subunit alpha [Fusobacterium gastrosuis]MDY4010553.1 ornithine aminomutase subunit alpha [Fusobacterium gastrosuis]MDY5795353.1 ornithine aminomutase subunit alpha [Fusobacterium gastrosuis]
MKGYLKRDDDFQERRKKIAGLSDEELKARFWELAETIVNPLLKMAKENTSPSIERSVLLRMGFSSLEVKPLVEGAIERGLMGKGVGHIVYRVAKEKGITIREAGEKLIAGDYWDTAMEIFKGGR